LGFYFFISRANLLSSRGLSENTSQSPAKGAGWTLTPFAPVCKALKHMIEIRHIGIDEYNGAYQLMHENMVLYHDMYSLRWDQGWIEENYRDKDNYSIFWCGKWIGFLSLEWESDKLTIHTLQLSKVAQGNIYGHRVFEWILDLAETKGIVEIACRSFKDNPTVSLYKKLGFEVVSAKGFLLELRVSFNKARQSRRLRRRCA